jgi:hypothetical protein
LNATAKQSGIVRCPSIWNEPDSQGTTAGDGSIAGSLVIVIVILRLTSHNRVWDVQRLIVLARPSTDVRMSSILDFSAIIIGRDSRRCTIAGHKLNSSLWLFDEVVSDSSDAVRIESLKERCAMAISRKA